MLENEQKWCKTVVWLLAVLFIGVSALSYADTVVRLPLKYRSAVDVQAVISPLVSKDGAITADGRAVLLRAPDKEAKRLISIIRAIDKPKALLRVSIFRGKHPDKNGSKIASTDTGINHLQTISIEDGQTLVVGEKQVLKIPMATVQYATQFANRRVDNSDVGTGSEAAIVSGSPTSGEILGQKQYALQQIPTGMHLRLDLLDKQQVRVHLKVVTPHVSDTSELHTENKHSRLQTITLSQSVETMSTIPLARWAKLSENAVFSHRAVLDHYSKTYSIQSTADAEESVWVKVENNAD